MKLTTARLRRGASPLRICCPMWGACCLTAVQSTCATKNQLEGEGEHERE
jgi:hypothetical protein